MASVRKRVLPSGKQVWLAAYVDGAGARRFKQFATRKEADAFLLRARSEVAAGSHVPDREASTVQAAYDALIKTLEADGAARATIHNYVVYYRGHVRPFLAKKLLPKIQPADVGDWLATLKSEGRTDDTCRRAKVVLGVIYDEAIRRRMAHVNPVRSLRSRRKVRRVEIAEAEEKVRIPERDVVREILAAAADIQTTYLIARDSEDRIVAVKRVMSDKPIVARRAFAAEHPGMTTERYRPAEWFRPLLATMAFAGLRIGEARGLAWRRVKADSIAVREAVDRYNERGPVKTAAALRDVPIGPLLNGMLGNWRAASAKVDAEGQPIEPATDALVFPSEVGTPLSYRNVMQRQLGPIQAVLGMVDDKGAPLWSAHAFRHFAVSLWIAEGASLKQVSVWAGHESPEFSMRVYGHLFASGRSDRKAVTAAERSVLGDASATPEQHEHEGATNVEVLSVR
ncbi:tyrosine-type recombinase/integrase [Enterovirga rhinocerotis]|uniref:Phage integrase family protein n=1 Tax=Enterovirga rhinocerotis TaxID=1339210 RepID=A0A4R7BY43_9HYPH|nr:tyrosine-type recombinase/integrase [Enterovirga rhinocerotis]TDR89127.1 phage integrase family protein [Enterovirga rhinocerotis]